ncbi:response regulator [Chryseobacterium sp. KACC 21268]|nr:response regulator [Chryseobacterium sp. KACC 21268]
MAKKRILIFDDDLATLEVLQIVLVDVGYEIDISPTSHNIIERVSDFVPDLVLMDHQIPDIGGVAAIKLLRTYREFAKIPVLLVSASNQIVSLKNVSGADDYIRKPFDLGDLETLIMKYLG